MSKSFIHTQKINGYLHISFGRDGYITLTDENTGQSLMLHHTVLQLLQQGAKTNYPTTPKRKNKAFQVYINDPQNADKSK